MTSNLKKKKNPSLNLKNKSELRKNVKGQRDCSANKDFCWKPGGPEFPILSTEIKV